MQEAFTRPRLAGYTAAMGPAVAAGLDAWEPGADFRLYPALKELTLDLATQVFMGGADAGRSARGRSSTRSTRRSSPASRPPPRSCGSPSPARGGAGPWPGGGCSRSSSAATWPSGACSRRSSSARRGHAGRAGRPVLGALRAAGRGRLRAQRRGRRQPHDLPADGRARHLDDHRHHDDAAPRGPPGVARAAARGGGAPPRQPDARRARRARVLRPGDEGVPAAGPAGPGAGPPHGQGHRGARRTHPGRPAGRGDAAPRAPPAGALARPRAVRPRAVRRRTGARTRCTGTPGSRSAAACTSASGCSSPAPR